MNIETRLKESLQEKAKEIIPAPELKLKVLSNISGTRKIKQRMVIGILTALLLIPTGVFASQSHFSDEIYGSYENLKKHIISITMEEYLRFDAKLAQAQGELKDEEYNEFKELVKKWTTAKLEYGDQYGNINFEDLPKKKEAEMEKVLSEIQPYFDRLNELPSSKELLTKDEYKKYIESLMVHQEIIARCGINPNHYVKPKEISTNLRAEFQEASNFINYVNEKQTQ